jgi:hypothetical protein
MLSMTPRAARVFLAFALLALPAAAQASSPWLLGRGEFHSEFLGGYYSSDTYFDDTGERPDLGATYETRGIRNSTQLGAWKRVTLRFDVPFESNTLVPDGGGEGTTQSGLSDLSLGLRYGIVTGETAVAIEAIWRTPLGYHRDFVPPLGDGRQDGIALLHAGTTIPAIQGFVQAAGGYRARLDGYEDTDPAKDEVVASADFGFWVGPSLMISGSYRGRFESSDADLPLVEHRVGPRITYRVDDFFDVIAGSSHTAAGENTLHVNEYFVGFATKRTQLDRLKGFLGSKRRP